MINLSLLLNQVEHVYGLSEDEIKIVKYSLLFFAII